MAIEGVPQIQGPVSLGAGLSLCPINFKTHHYDLLTYYDGDIKTKTDP